MRLFRLLIIMWLAVMPVLADSAIIAPLIDPVKLDTLQGDRAANRRLRLIAYWLEDARRKGHDPASVIDEAQQNLGYFGTPRADAVKSSLLRNLVILERFGCLDDEGMAKLRRGNAPKITRGPYAGDIASVNHIIPRSIARGLDNRLYNLEFMPSRMNIRMGAIIGQRNALWRGIGTARV